MTKHLPECPVAVARPGTFTSCICDALRACEARMLNAAREAVEAIPAPYKIRGDFDTFGAYAEGRADFKDAALTVIDAIKGEQ